MYNKQLIRLRATQAHRKGMVKTLKLEQNILSPGYDLIYEPGLLSFIENPMRWKSTNHKIYHNLVSQKNTM